MSHTKYILYVNKNISTISLQNSFSYGNTRKIMLGLKKKGAAVSFSLTTDYSTENPYLYGLLKESIKRIALLYILQYHKPLTIKCLKLIITRSGTDSETVDITDSLVFYQMFETPLLRPISSEWKNPCVIKNLLRYRKSKDDLSQSVAALYAYLFSKTKKIETERFSYLWIAMNGFFAVSTHAFSDREQMKEFVKKFGLGSAVLSKNERDKEGKIAMVQLMKLIEPVSKEKIEGDIYESFAEYINNLQYKYNLELTPYGFLLTDFPYYLRCKLFHAQRPIELFSFMNDMELKSLRIVNGLLENFLDINLHTLFIETELLLLDQKSNS